MIGSLIETKIVSTLISSLIPSEDSPTPPVWDFLALEGGVDLLLQEDGESFFLVRVGPEIKNFVLLENGNFLVTESGNKLY